MPSKKKPSRPAPSSPSPRTPSTPLSAPSKSSPPTDDDSLHSLLSSASARHPHLISTTAVCATISDSDPSPSNGNRATVWLSDSTLASSSLTNGSLVSVSLFSHSHLDSLAEQCAKRFGIDLDHTSVVAASGCYFAIATVYASSKVPKNGARLSWGLSCTMGFPDTGKSIFVSSVSVSNKCEKLFLNLVHPKDDKVGVDGGNGDVGSPRTPSSARSRISAPVSRAGSAFCWDNSVVKLALEDDKAKGMLETLAVRWLNRRYLLVGNFVIVPITGQLCVFQVGGADRLSVSDGKSDMVPSDSIGEIDATILVDTRTKIYLSDAKSQIQEMPNKCSFTSVGAMVNAVTEKKVSDAPRLGGLSREFAALKEIIMFSLLNKNPLLPRYKGVLLYGPPGTGKTSLVSSCVLDVGASLFSINGPEIVSQYYGESEQTLHEVFVSASRAAPAVVFIDELDAIAPARKDGGEELSLRLVATLLKLMDEIGRDDGRVLVIAATNRPDSIDSALRRHGRLDREIEIGVPSPDQRLDILQTVLSGIDNSLSNTEIQSLAMATHGFVGADLAALCNEAAMTNLRSNIKLKNSGKWSKEPCPKTNGLTADLQGFDVHKDEYSSSGEHMDSLLSSLSELSVSAKPLSPVNLRANEEMLLKVTFDDFEKAKMKVRPSAMREVMLELPQIRWEDVGGQTKVKKQLIEAVQWPQINPGAFQRVGIRPPRGVLMIGPPGCSKTLMARAVASEAKLNFLAVKGPELFSKWVGESEKAVKSLFAKARVNSPAIIFFDEIDGLATTRGQENDGTSVADRVLSQLLVEMDGLDECLGVTVIGATNRPDKIDDALLRPGRFDRLVDVQPPDETDREDIFRIHMRNMPCSSNVCMKNLARLTEGYTGADIKLICREAAIAALEESLEISEVSMAHFETGIGRVRPSDLQFYKELAAEFRRFVDTGPVRDEVSWLNS